MHEAKNTQRALVRIGFDGKVHKQFRGPKAKERYANEVRVLEYLESRECPNVPRLLSKNPETLEIETTNCGARVQHISDERVAEIFSELEGYGVRHDDPYLRNITYRALDGRFCVIDFEFAEIIGEELAEPREKPTSRRSSEPIHLAWSGCTHRGRFRPNNEDAFLAMVLDARGIRYLGKTGEASLTNSDFLFAVSDGMGGERSGEFASRIAMEKITLRLPKEFETTEDRFTAYSNDILTDLFKSIHQAMLELGRYDINCRDMGATLTLAWFRGGRVYFGHIGDSRLYHLPVSGEMRQVTEDHTHVGWLRRQGQLNERQARFHPRKNVLSQALGAGHRYLNPHIGMLDYQPGDRFLLSTDGLNEGLWDRALEDTIRANPSWDGKHSQAEQLVDAANAACGRDNATAVVVETK
jgi:PPM family protein phosphatase